jgi:hypothetical protein
MTDLTMTYDKLREIVADFPPPPRMIVARWWTAGKALETVIDGRTEVRMSEAMLAEIRRRSPTVTVERPDLLTGLPLEYEDRPPKYLTDHVVARLSGAPKARAGSPK